MQLAVLALAVLAASCGGSSDFDLFVDLQTDLIPGEEFAAVRTTLVGEGRMQMEPAFRGRPYLEGQRVAELVGLEPAMRTVRVDLLDADGEPVATRTIRLQHESDFALEALVTRDCVGMECSCFGGTCVEPECITGEEAACPDPECTMDSECTSGASCSTGLCRKGRCVSESDDEQCSGDGYCHPDRGCIEPPLAVYELDEGTGDTARDTSGREPPLDLRTFTGTDATWIDGGVRLAPGEPFLGTAEPASRLREACRETGELSVAVWMRTDDVDQGGPARIVTHSTDTAERNFTLGHGLSQCSRTEERAVVGVRLRLDDEANACSNPVESSDPSVTTELMHVVFTRASAGGRRLYIDGDVAAEDVAPGNFDAWTDAPLLLGAENMDDTLMRRWDGELHHVAIWNRALTDDEVTRLYELGPGDFASF